MGVIRQEADDRSAFFWMDFVVTSPKEGVLLVGLPNPCTRESDTRKPLSRTNLQFQRKAAESSLLFTGQYCCQCWEQY